VDLREQISLARGRCISPTSPSCFTPPSGGGSFSAGEKLLLTTDLLVVRSGRCGADKVGGDVGRGDMEDPSHPQSITLLRGLNRHMEMSFFLDITRDTSSYVQHTPLMLSLKSPLAHPTTHHLNIPF
jgi:hypothetical protein